MTVDPYMSIVEYNLALQALRNNSVPFSQVIHIKAPFYWFFDLPYAPMLVNYELADKSVKRFCVTKVIPVRPADDYLLQRRESNGLDGLVKYIENQPLAEARESKYALFFNAGNAEILRNASKNLPGIKIYYFGKFVSGKYKVALCTNPMIKNFIPMNSILIEKDLTSKGAKALGGSEGTGGNAGNDYSKPGFFEADLNFRVFKNKDLLDKYSETPYFLDGNYVQVKFQGTYDDPGKINRFVF